MAEVYEIRLDRASNIVEATQDKQKPRHYCILSCSCVFQSHLAVGSSPLRYTRLGARTTDILKTRNRHLRARKIIQPQRQSTERSSWIKNLGREMENQSHAGLHEWYMVVREKGAGTVSICGVGCLPHEWRWHSSTRALPPERKRLYIFMERRGTYLSMSTVSLHLHTRLRECICIIG